MWFVTLWTKIAPHSDWCIVSFCWCLFLYWSHISNVNIPLERFFSLIHFFSAKEKGKEERERKLNGARGQLFIIIKVANFFFLIHRLNTNLSMGKLSLNQHVFTGVFFIIFLSGRMANVLVCVGYAGGGRRLLYLQNE